MKFINKLENMKIIDNLLFHLSQPHLNIIKTVYFNMRTLPFHIAIKFPILIYGHVKFYYLKGKVEIYANEIYRGMIKFGRNNEFFNGVDKSAFILLEENSKLIFEGPCAIANNYKLRIARNGVLQLGAYTFFGSAIRIVCTTHISIGKYTRCAYESQIIDTNSHFVLNEKNGCVAHRKGEIVIGEYNWIGNRTTFNKGAHTKDYTIVCAGSMVNKDFVQREETHMMIGGCPAKIITDGLRRIFSTSIEKQIIKYFEEHPQDKYYKIGKVTDEDMSDIIYWFKNVM